jgi:hypothetical protein
LWYSLYVGLCWYTAKLPAMKAKMKQAERVKMLLQMAQ